MNGHRKDFIPAAVLCYEKGKLKEKMEMALELLRNPCRVCPRNCKIDRLKDERGVCLVGRKAIVSSAFPHFGEEDVLRGWNGSGTIFFSGCNLKCVFCQNWDISQVVCGEELSGSEIARIMIYLQEAGCHNINFVTPEHVVPQVIEAIYEAVKMGLRIPVVYNTSAYDSEESLALLEGVVDIYMPDFKLWEEATCSRYLKAGNYREVAQRSILTMWKQVGDLLINENGLAWRGVLIRHLVMPGLIEESKKILKWIVDNLGTGTYVNIMAQYYPANKVGKDGKYQEIARRIYEEEYREVVKYAFEIGLTRLDGRFLSRISMPHEI